MSIATQPCEHDPLKRIADCEDCGKKWICVCAADAYYFAGVKCCQSCDGTERMCECGDPVDPEDA